MFFCHCLYMWMMTTKINRRKNPNKALSVPHQHYHTVHLFTRLLPCPALQLKTRSNWSKFDVGPKTLQRPNEPSGSVDAKREISTWIDQGNGHQWECGSSRKNCSFSNTTLERSWWKTSVRPNIYADPAVFSRLFQSFETIFDRPKESNRLASWVERSELT